MDKPFADAPFADAQGRQDKPLDEAILGTLKSTTGFVSGEELSRTHGISRTAIWKHIEKLRQLGYQIAAQPHSGYRLAGSPDKLYPHEVRWGLETELIGRRVVTYDQTDSTMAIAHQLALAGEPEGTVVLAEGQTKGRGRLGRVWVSPHGQGLYLSVILRPPLGLAEVARLTILAGIAVAQAAEEVSGVRVNMRWPNDVLVKQRKLCGILTEVEAEQDRVNYAVVGIGLNVNAESPPLPPEATSLRLETGTPYPRIRILQALLSHLDRCYRAFVSQPADPDLWDVWRRYATFLGKQIMVQTKSRLLEGQAVDIDPNGSLILRLSNGLNETITTGDVIVVR